MPSSAPIGAPAVRSPLGLNRSLGGAIALIAVVTMLGGAAVAVALGRLDAAIEARGQAHRIIRDGDAFLIAMLKQETGLRG